MKTMNCSDCPASLACVAGSIGYGIWCKDCGHVFVKIGREGTHKQEIKIPWQLRYFCKHAPNRTSKPNLNGDSFPDPWDTKRCFDCAMKHQASIPSGQQKIFMTRAQYDDLVDSLRHIKDGVLDLPNTVPLSFVNTPADKLGMPAGFIHGIPVRVVPEYILGKDKMLFIGSDNKNSVVVTNIGNKTVPLSPSAFESALHTAEAQEKQRRDDKWCDDHGISRNARLPEQVTHGMAHDIAAEEDRKFMETISSLGTPATRTKCSVCGEYFCEHVLGGTAPTKFTTELSGTFIKDSGDDNDTES